MSADKSPLEPFIPLIAGGCGGTAGAVVTCPLEVVKTRLQSSNSGFPKSPDHWVECQRAIKQGKASLVARAGARKHLVAVPLQAQPVTAATQVSPSSRMTLQDLVASERRGQTSCRTALSRSWFHHQPSFHQPLTTSGNGNGLYNINFARYMTTSSHPGPERRMNLWHCLRFIFATEGIFGLFKGLGPNLMGVIPSRAIYFWSYSTAKSTVNGYLPASNRDAPFVHVVSALTAGVSVSTLTNPIWLIKTRLQLDRTHSSKTLTIRKAVKQIYNEKGIRSFWRGVTASYWGAGETVIFFVIYEQLKKQREIQAQLQRQSGTSDRGDTSFNILDFGGTALCSGAAKLTATCIAYPHEVARTRLREQGSRYTSFWQTLRIVFREEGKRGLYRGLGTQLVRQIPNSAIMMGTYEFTEKLLTRWTSRGRHSAYSDLQADLKDAAKDAATPVRN